MAGLKGLSRSEDDLEESAIMDVMVFSDEHRWLKLNELRGERGRFEAE